MTTRTEKALIRDGAAWVRAEREALGWPPRKLAIRAWMMRECSGVQTAAPTTAEIIAFEAGDALKLPRWLLLVQDVFAFMETPAEARAAWVEHRSWRRAGHPIDMSEAILFRDEAMLLDDVRRMEEGDRRAWRAAIARWPRRGCEKDRVGAAREWLRRLDVPVDALLDDERQLLADFRRLSSDKRADLSDAVREQAFWPPRSALRLSDDEMELVTGYRSANDGDDRILLFVMATDPTVRANVIRAILRDRPQSDGATAA